MEEKLYWLGFSAFPGVGPKRFKALLDKFHSAENAWKADKSELERVLGRFITANFSEFRKAFKSDVYYQKLITNKVSFLTLTDEEYPSLLKEIKDSPFVLYFKAHNDFFNSLQRKRKIAIVGTRKITSYGREVTRQLTEELVDSGFVIVSGLAYGVDACAHKTTIESKGITIAVLGCGVDCCNPSANLNLYNQIIDTGGAIISEIPLGIAPTKGSFPSRNRIIAGLSEAVIVTEGAEDSGALYTAEDALNIGRLVFAVPGQITSQLSKGPNSLIAKGAKLVMGIEDIMQELMANGEGQIVNQRKAIVGDNEEEQAIIDLLLNEELHFDELIKKINIDSSKLGTILSIMEMKGLIKSHSGTYGLIC